MNVVISIEHPAWAHQFRYIIEELKRRGDNVTVLAVNKDGDLELLDTFGIPYVKMADSTGKNTFEKGILFLKLCISYANQCRKAKADILIGRLSPMMSVAAFLVHRPHVLYDDSEVCVLGVMLAKLFSSKFITPIPFYKNIGKKQIRASMYKELYYLDPSHFTPDKDVLRKNAFNPDERYVVVRFVAWQASHDFGFKGLNDKDKIKYVEELSKYARVYISSEKPLSNELEKYRINIPYELIHHVLYYAQMVISDGATMASEAVVLGTHAVRLCPIKCGTFIEQEEKYNLLKWFPGSNTEWFNKSLEYAKNKLSNDDLWDLGKRKREVLLNNMVDCNKFFIDTMDEVLYSRKLERRKHYSLKRRQFD